MCVAKVYDESHEVHGVLMSEKTSCVEKEDDRKRERERESNKVTRKEEGSGDIKVKEERSKLFGYSF